MKPGAWFPVALIFVCLLLAAAAFPRGQSPRELPADAPQSGIPAGQSTVFVKVLGEDGTVLTRLAFIVCRGEGNQPENWTTTRGAAEVTLQGLGPGTYSIEVSAPGFRSVSEKVEIPKVGVAVKWVTITLARDAASVPLSAGSASAVPPKARKETERGLEALKAGKLTDAEAHLLKADKQAPQTADIHYLLGAVSLEKKDLARAESYLAKAVALDPRHVRALTSLGGVRLQQENYASGVKVLEQAVAADPRYWMAHSLLANGYLKQGEAEKARQQAQLALDTGKAGAISARLPLGEALARLAKYEEAIAMLESFLRESPDSPEAPEVRAFISELRNPAGTPSASGGVGPVKRNLGMVLAAEPQLSTPTWGPPSIDDVRPAVAPGMACPEQRVLDGAAARLNELVDNIARFDAVEEVVHEDQDKFGKPLARSTRKFAYFAAISRPLPGMPKVEEDRQSLSALGGFPGGIATFGLPTLAFVFHPGLRENYELACEGLGEWQGQSTWLMHFRQRDERPNYLQAYNIGNRLHPVALKGRAWVAANSYQIVHMEAELVRPLPQIQLLTQHHIVDYGVVTFKKNNAELWLPKQAELYFHFRGHRYYRRHSFDNFRLFSVDATEKVKGPKETGSESKGPPN